MEKLKRKLAKEKRERREDALILKREIDNLNKELEKMRGQMQIIMEANKDFINEMERKKEEEVERKISSLFEEWTRLKENKRRRREEGEEVGKEDRMK